MADQRILPGYEEQIYGQPMKLKRRKSGWAKKLIISLIVTVVIIGGLIGAALMVGDYLCRENLGVSMWTLFDIMGDLKKDDSAEIVTNAYSDSDVNDFYSNINSNLFLKESAGTKDIVDGLMSGIISSDGSSDALQNDVLALFSFDNIDNDRLEDYSGWQNINDDTHLVPYTDRQFAAFFDNMIFGAIDQLMDGQMPYGIKMSDFAQIDQLIIANGADVDSYYNPTAGNVYMTMTASINLYTFIESTLDSMEFDAGSIMWLVRWLVPQSLYFTMTFDMSDAGYSPVFEINRLDRVTCSYKAVGADEAVEMTKQERIFEVISTIVGKISQNESYDFNATLDNLATNMESFIVSDENAGFSLGNYIKPGSVAKTPNGNRFKIDLLGSFMSMAGSGLDLLSSDVIVLMQSVMCPDTAGILEDAPGAPVYVPCGGGGGEPQIVVSNDFTEDDGETENTNIDQYTEEFLRQLAYAYGITVTELDENDEIVYLYTVDDLYGALGFGDETDNSAQLMSDINNRIIEMRLEGETPTVQINDEMLCAIMYSMLDGSDADLADYGMTFRKLGIENKEDEDGVMRSYAKMYCTFDFDSLIGDDSMMSSIIDNMLGGKSMLFEIIMDVTVSEQEGFENEPVDLVVNGLDGSSLNGLTTEYVTGILEKISSFDFGSLLVRLGEMSQEAVGNIISSPLVGVEFVPSEPRIVCN